MNIWTNLSFQVLPRPTRWQRQFLDRPGQLPPRIWQRYPHRCGQGDQSIYLHGWLWIMIIMIVIIGELRHFWQDSPSHLNSTLSLSLCSTQLHSSAMQLNAGCQNTKTLFGALHCFLLGLQQPLALARPSSHKSFAKYIWTFLVEYFLIFEGKTAKYRKKR